MTEEEQQINQAQTQALAVCVDCGHKWTPKNPSPTANRKCSKCKSQNIRIENVDISDVKTSDLTPEQINSLIIGTPEPEPEPQTESAEETSSETEPVPLQEPKQKYFTAHPTLIFIGIAALIGLGAVVYFRRWLKKRHTKQAPQHQTEEEEKTRSIRPVIAHYAENGGI